MVVPVVVIRDVVAFGRTFLEPEQVRLAVVPEMVIAERNVRGKLAVKRAIALHLVLVATRIAVEEVAVVHPHVLVVLLQADVVALVAVHVHDSEVADFHVLRVLDADAPAVHCRVGTNALHRYVGVFGLAEVNHHVTLHERIGIRHVADNAQVERSRLVALLVAIQNALEALACCLCALGARRHVHRHGILGALGNIKHGGAVLERAVGLVRTGNTVVAKRETATVVRLYRERLRRGGCALLAVLDTHDFQRVVTRLEARHVDAPGGTVLADKLRIDLHVGFPRAAIVHVVAVGAVGGPFRIGRFEPSSGISEGHLGTRHGHQTETRESRHQTFHKSIPSWRAFLRHLIRTFSHFLLNIIPSKDKSNIFFQFIKNF